MDEEVGAGAREALRGRAGVSARVVTGGVLRVGDRARVETAPAVAGSLHQINISSGGVPKLPVPAAVVTINGIEGDGHHDLEHHGGPLRALCLFSLEAIERLATEGHPIGAGSAGENLTVSGLDWNEVVPGARLRIGPEVEIEVTNYTTPCRKNAHWFLGGDFMQIHQARRPGMSRVYARVIREGRIEAGQAVVFA
jgi:MOSC domain-containing protein YiiM